MSDQRASNPSRPYPLSTPTKRFLFLAFTSTFSIFALPMVSKQLQTWFQPFPRSLLPHFSLSPLVIYKPFSFQSKWRTYVGLTQTLLFLFGKHAASLAYSLLFLESISLELDASEFSVEWDDDDDDDDDDEDEENDDDPVSRTTGNQEYPSQEGEEFRSVRYERVIGFWQGSRENSGFSYISVPLFASE